MRNSADEIWIGNQVNPDFLDLLKGLTAPLSEDTTHPSTSGIEDSLIDPLPLLCGNAVGADPHQVNLITNVWNLFQTAAQILDALEDGDKRGEPLSQFSPGELINISTSLIILAELTLSELEANTQIDAATANDLRVHFNRHILIMCSGQHDDLNKRETSLEQCWQTTEAKSGEFFSLACYAGARLGTKDPVILNNFRLFGHHIGTIIQIKDDLSGLWDDDTNPSDLAKSQYSLPVCYALSVLPDSQADHLRNLIENPQLDRAVAQARKLIVESGAVLYLSMEIEKRKQLAMMLLSECCPDGGPAYQQLVRILDHVSKLEEKAIIHN